MDAQLRVEEKFSQCNGTRILPGKCRSTVRGFFDSPQQHDHLVIYKMIFWFCFTCIKISSRSLTLILNLVCASDVTCSYDVIMRK